MQGVTKCFPPVLRFHMNFPETQYSGFTAPSGSSGLKNRNQLVDERSGGSWRPFTFPERQFAGLTKTQRKNRRRHLKKREELFKKAISQSMYRNVKTFEKKPMLDITIPSSACPEEKSSEQATEMTSTQAVELTKIVIVNDNFPHEKLSSNDQRVVMKKYLQLIDRIPEGEPLPRVHSTSLQAGVIVLHCEDEYTTEWIKKQFDGDTTTTGSKLRVTSSELSNLVKVVFRTTDKITTDGNVLLRRMQRLTPVLQTMQWCILERQDEENHTRWIFEVSEAATESIRELNFEALTGLDRGVFEIIPASNEDEKPSVEKEAEIPLRYQLKQNKEESGRNPLHHQVEYVLSRKSQATFGSEPRPNEKGIENLEFDNHLQGPEESYIICDES